METFDSVTNQVQASSLAELVSEALERDSRRYFTDLSVKEDEI